MAYEDVLGWTSSPWAQAGAAGLGGLGDIWSFIENMKRTGNMRDIYQILQNPAQLSAYASQLMPQYSPQAMGVFNRGVNANWASTTGGAPGGAAQQFTADAWAKLLSENWATALRSALGGLGEASGTAYRMPQQGLGALGGVTNALKMLAQIRQGGQGSNTGITSFPLPGGGGGYGGGSEGFRGDYAPSPSFKPDTYSSGFDFGGAGY